MPSVKTLHKTNDPDSDEDVDPAAWIESPKQQDKLMKSKRSSSSQGTGTSGGTRNNQNQMNQRPCSPLRLMDYGSASVKPIATTAFTRPHKSGEKVISNPRCLLAYDPSGGGGGSLGGGLGMGGKGGGGPGGKGRGGMSLGSKHYPYTVLEPHLLQPSLDPIHANHFEHIEHQPLLKSHSFSHLQKEKEKDLLTCFKKEKICGVKGLTNAYIKSFSHIWGNENRRRVQDIIESQRTYDASHGVTFRDLEKTHFDWLEKNASDPDPCWLDQPREEWTNIQKKAYDILSILFRDFLRSEKKSIRLFFLQNTKHCDWKRRIDPHATEMRLILDWTRLKRNLEMWNIVNAPGKPTLAVEEMYPLMQAFGENYDGVINIDSFTALVRKFGIVYTKYMIESRKVDAIDRARNARAARAGSTEAFVRQHWPNRVACVSRGGAFKSENNISVNSTLTGNNNKNTVVAKYGSAGTESA